MRHLLTQFGEASVNVGGQVYLVRPSFRAIASLGDASDIADYVSEVCYAYELHVNGHTPPLMIICACANVLEMCSDIPGKLLGFAAESPKDGRLIYGQGKIPVSDIIIMANHCIKWGINGDPKWKDPPKKNKAIEPRPFEPAEFVSILIDEFHMSRDDAWGATMTEFQRLCEQRARTQHGDKPPPPSEESAQKAMQHARDAIKRAREMGIKPKKMTNRTVGRK